MLEITIKGVNAEGKSTLAFLIAKTLEENGFTAVKLIDDDYDVSDAAKFVSTLQYKIDSIKDRLIEINQITMQPETGRLFRKLGVENENK